MRDTDQKRSIDEDWIRKLPVLTRNDIENDDEWHFATIATTGNVERMKIIEYQAKRFGKAKNEPILNWTCPIKKEKMVRKHIRTG